MWITDPKKIKAEEDFFRENATDLFDYQWNRTSSLMYFSKDFIREFRDKFTWKNTESKVILRMLGHEFYKEIMGESYKL